LHRSRRPTFTKSIIDIDVEKLDPKIRSKITKTYLNDPGFTYEAVNKASKACGPLVKWVTSTLSFAKIKRSVAPLEAELAALEAERAAMVEKAAALDATLAGTGERIAALKAEYSALIGEAQSIRSEMETVRARVERSVALLDNLGEFLFFSHTWAPPTVMHVYTCLHVYQIKFACV
jgi:dynein heavy chain 1